MFSDHKNIMYRFVCGDANETSLLMKCQIVRKKNIFEKSLFPSTYRKVIYMLTY